MGVGAAIAGSAALSAGTSLLGSSQASGAAGDATAASEAQAAQTRADLMPYNTTGQNALVGINNNLDSWGTSDPQYINYGQNFLDAARGYTNAAQAQYGAAAQIGQGPNGQAALEATPGYQFTKAQGLQAVQNSASARGLGVSGAALKGAAAYATGLADQTYQQQYADAMQNAAATAQTGQAYGNYGTQAIGLNTAAQGNLTNSYNRLLGVGQLGENAAAQTGITGAANQNSANQATIAGGNASAAGLVGAGNSATGAVNSYLGYNALQNALGGNGGAGDGFSGVSAGTLNSLASHGAISGYVPF